MASRVSRETVAKAVAALLRWMHARAAERKPQLLLDAGDDVICIQASLRRIPDKYHINPILLPLPHPLFDSSPSSSLSVCLIADDRPYSPSLTPAAALDRARAIGLPLADAIGLSSLAADYRPYEARRRLCDSHDLFVADRRLLPLLPRLIGKDFFEKKKAPLPIDTTRPGWPEQLLRCLRSTFLYFRSGTCCGLKVGRLSMDQEQIVDNIMAVIEAAVERVPKKWSNIRSLHIKSVDSVALPIYQAVPEIGLKIDVPQNKDFDNGKAERDDGEVVDVALEGDGGKGKKRKAAGKKTKKEAKLHRATRYIDGEGDLIGRESADEDGTDEEPAKEGKKKRAKKEKKKNSKEAGNAKKGKDRQQEDAGLLSFDEELSTVMGEERETQGRGMKKGRSKVRS